MDFDVSMDESTARSSSFKDLLQSLVSENYGKRTSEKAALLEKALLLLEMQDVQKSLVEDEWRYIVQAIGSLTRAECDENVKKLSQNTKSFKKGAFALWKCTIQVQLTYRPTKVLFSDLAGTLLKCLVENGKVWSQVDSGVWMDTIALLTDVLRIYSPTDIPYSKFKSIWKISVSKLKKCLSNEKRSERQKLCELFETLVKSFHCTEFHMEIAEVIADCQSITNEYRWPAKDPAKTNLLEALIDLFANYGFEQRDNLLNNFFPVTELYIHMRIFTPSEDSFAENKALAERKTSNFQSSFYEFLDWVAILSVPDCEVNSFSYQPVFPFVQDCLRQIVDEIAEQINKSISAFRPTSKCVLPICKIPLIARLFAINHLFWLKNNSVITSSNESRPKPKKRSRKSGSFLVEVLLRSNALPHLQILWEILCSWKHRLDQQTIELMCQTLMKTNKNFAKDEDKLIVFTNILAELVEMKPNSLANEDVFNWALPLLHNRAAHNSVCALLVKLLSTASSSSPLSCVYTFNVLINNISRLSSFQSGTLVLIQFLISNYDFDESSVFRAELSFESGVANSLEHVADGEIGERSKLSCLSYEWCFRSQLISAILTCSEPEIDVIDSLLALMCYVPNTICGKVLQEGFDKIDLTCEKLLSKLYCSKNGLQIKKKKSKTKEDEIQIIDSLVGVCARAISTVCNSEFIEVDKKCQMWRTTNRLLSRFIDLRALSDFEVAPLKNVQSELDDWFVVTWDALFSENKQMGSSYDLLDLHGAWRAASSNVKNFLERRAESGASPLFRFVVHWNSDIPTEFLKETLKSYKDGANPILEELLIAIVDNVSSFDLIRIIQRFGEWLSSETLLCIIMSLIEKAGDEQLNNVSGSSRQSEFASQKSFFSSLKSEEPGEQNALWRSLAADEILQFVGMSKLASLANSHTKLRDFLLQNASAKMLAIGFGAVTLCTCSNSLEIENVFFSLDSRFERSSIERLTFLRTCLNVELHELHPEVLKQLLLSFNYLHCVEFVPQFEEFIYLYEDNLAYLFGSSGEKCLDSPSIDRLLSQALERPMLRFLIDSVQLPEVYCSPAIFFLSRSLLKSIIRRTEFQAQWQRLFQVGNYARIFFSLRNQLYKRKSAVQEDLIATVVLNAVILLFENFDWNAFTNNAMAFMVLLDILSIANYLFKRAAESEKCADANLLNLYSSWFTFISKLEKVHIFQSRLYPLALQVLDKFMDRKLDYPLTWSFLSSSPISDASSSDITKNGELDNNVSLNYARMYCQCFVKRDGFERLPNCSGMRSIESSCGNTLSIDEMDCSDMFILRGFWKCMMTKLSDENLCEANLQVVCQLYFFYSFLRADLMPLISLHHTSQIKMTYDGLLRRLWIDDTLEEFLQQISHRLLLCSDSLYPPSVNSAFYNCLTPMITNKDSSCLVLPVLCDAPDDDEFDVNAENTISCSEVADVSLNVADFLHFLHRCRCFSQFPRGLEMFLPVAKYFPVYSTFIISRIIKEMGKSTATKQRKTIIDECNLTCIAALNSKSTAYSELDVFLLLAVVSIAEVWPDCIAFFDLVPLVRCLVKAHLFENAHYFLKYYVDFVHSTGSKISDPRTMFYVQDDEDKHFIESVKDNDLREELLKFLVEIYIGMKDSVLLSTVPLYAKIGNKPRLFIAESNCDWGAVSGLCSSIGNVDKMADAFYYLGSEGLQQCSIESQYATTLKLASWDQLSVARARISFPKSAQFHSQRLYKIAKLSHDGKNACIERCLMNLLENTRSDNQHVLNFCKVEPLRNLVVLDNHLKYSDKRNSLSKPKKMCLMALTAYEMARATSEFTEKDYSNTLNVVVKRCRELRKLQSYQPALKLLDKLEKIMTMHASVKFLPRTFMERAKVLVANKEYPMASYFLKRLVSEFEFADGNLECHVDDFNSLGDASELTMLKIKAHLLLSQIASDHEHAMQSLKEACAQSNHVVEKHQEFCCKNYVKYAVFCEKRYRELRAFSETPAFALKEEAVNQWEKELKEMMVTNRKTISDKNEKARKEREIECEKHDLQKVSEGRSVYLREASKYYLDALTFDSNTDATVIHRFAALLMQNVENRELMSLAMAHVDRVLSVKWLPILNVLSSHLFSRNLPIAELVNKIAFNAVRDHPFHSVNHLLFYIGSSSTDLEISETRKRIAMGLLKRIMDTDANLKQIISSLKRALDVYREFGKSDISKFEKATDRGKSFFKIPKKQRILSDLELLQSTPIPTLTQRLNLFGDYNVSDLITFKSIEQVCEKADGLSAPKVVIVVGSDGVKYKIIFKKEDLRQDGLIQQLFHVSNLLMGQNQPTAEISKGFVPLRTYNVLPLDSEQGLIEWCAGTQSLCGYLAGPEKKTGAHLRFRPKEPSVFDCRTLFTQLDTNRSDCSRLFLDICKKISPVFRYFFYEKFCQPEIFHKRIATYTSSLAQWSIVCYVVGLGDRHLTNILIDEETAELVHIDLGMIFEWSQRLLKIPEKVPFRLTRELADPILVDGINGRLKSIAVHTLNNMRNNAEVLIGISSILLHDPISTFKSEKMKSDKNQKNLFAEMAISRLKEKLVGRDLTYTGDSTLERRQRSGEFMPYVCWVAAVPVIQCLGYLLPELLG